MRKIICLFFIFSFAVLHVTAQIFPKENSLLHYRIIGFSFPAVTSVANYTVEIASGNCTSEDMFRKNIISANKTEKNKLIAEVPSFGKEYTWRAVWTEKSKTVTGSMHHFSCIISSEVDTSVTRLTILKSAERYKDAYVFMDGSNALYDMNGNPVWYLPVKGKLNPKKSKLWDMKLTPQNTITFLLDQNIYEVNYNGDVLWQGPNNGKVSGDSIEYYHHEFTKLDNGHYMVIGTEFVSWVLSGSADSSTHIETGKTKNEKSAKEKTAFGTLIEYDHAGNVIWSWKSSQYFKTLDPKYLRTELYDQKSPKQMVDVHENAFYFDEKEKVAYLSFKNISTIIKVKYPEGDVINIYGRLASLLNNKKTGNDLFCGQHSCKTTKNGYLFLYNNNACHVDASPKIMMFEQPNSPADTLKKIWEYDCSFEDVMDVKQKEAKYSNSKNDIVTPEQLSALNIFSKGGNIIELPGNDLFASICGIYGKVFIVSEEKETIWSAILETWNPYQRKWDDIINYKANIILKRKDLDELIWNSENK